MVKKNDISAFKNLPKNKKVVETAVKEAQAPKKAEKVVRKAGTMGRPPKPKAEKETVRIAFSLTQKESDMLAKKCGSLSPNIYIKNFIRDNTDLLK